MADDFQQWLEVTFLRRRKHEILDGYEVEVSRIALPHVLSAEQAHRAAVYLLRLSGHAPGPLPAGELEAIRGRAENGKSWESTSQAMRDRAALLAAYDALAAGLAAAEGALHDLTSPQSGEANAAYLRGVGDAAALLRRRAKDFRDEAARRGKDSEVAFVNAEIVAALESAALALESPPAPAAAPG